MRPERLIMEERESRMNSLMEWARNNPDRNISQRFARKYLEDDEYFWTDQIKYAEVQKTQKGFRFTVIP
jgi:hypothetical protein